MQRRDGITSRRPQVAWAALAGLAALLVLDAGARAVAPAPAERTCDGFVATIVGTREKDRIVGTEGDDVIVGLAGNDRIDGLAGDDVICGASGNDNLDGGPGNDRLFGQREGYPGRGDVLTGGSGDDFLDAGRGGFLLNTITYEAEASPIVVDLAAGTVTGDSSGTDTLGFVGELQGTEHDDVFAGSSGTDRIHSLGGDDVLRGRSGKDHLNGGAGSDQLFGNRGYDWLYGGPEADLLKIGRTYPPTCDIGCTDAAYGGEGDDRIVGSPQDDGPSITGGQGNDTILGRAGDDEIWGNAGDDTLDGGAGNDKGYGAGGTDTCISIERRRMCEIAP